MKRILLAIISVFLFSCEDIAKFGETFPMEYLTTQNKVDYIPKKDSYKVRENIEITCSFSAIVLFQVDRTEHINKIIGKLPERIIVDISQIAKEGEYVVDLFLNNIKQEDVSRLNFVYNKEEDSYFLSDKLTITFKKAGKYQLSDIFKLGEFKFDRDDTLFMDKLFSNKEITIEE